MDKTLSGGVNIYLNEAELAKQIERLSKQAETLNTKIANGSNAAKLTEEALKKMGDKEAELQKLQRASEALAKEIKQVEEYGGDATSRLREMGQVTSSITKVETQINSLKNSIQAAAKSEKELNENMAKLADVKDKIATVEKQMKGELAPSVKQAGEAVRKLYNELLNLPQGSAEAIEKMKEFDKANAAFAEMKGQIGGIGKAYESFVSQVKSVSLGVLIGNSVQSITETVLGGIKSLFSMGNEFESSIANLRAITGATGEDLEYLKNKAVELSTTTSNSAKDYVEAFKLIASAKPELLEDRDGLVAVTEAASLLSRAAGIDLPDASTRLTDALNQYGAPASEAKKYVDALAAAAKYGAAEVPQVTEALLQFGSVAKSSRVDIYESAGAIELLAEKGQKGADAGTRLRNVLIAMASAKGLDDKAVGSLKAYGVNLDIVTDSTKSFEDRLKELSKIGNDTTAMVNVFGKENITSAQIILQNIPRYAELASQIKNTGVASEQATANTKTFNSAFTQTMNGLKALLLTNLDNSWLTTIFSNVSESIRSLLPVEKSQQEQLYATRDAMNANLNALKDQQLSGEARKRLIQETNEKYGQYLPNLLTEKSTIEEITEVQQKSNNALMAKIYIIGYQEEIAKALKAEKAAREAIYETELRRAKQNAVSTENARQDNARMVEANNQLNNALQKASQQTIDETDGTVKKIEDKYKFLVGTLKMSWEEFLAMMNGTPKEDPNAGKSKTIDLDPDAEKKRKKELEEMKRFMEELEKLRNENAILGLDEDAKALAAVRTKYETMFDFAKAHFGVNGKITQELERFYADEVNRIGDKRTEKKFEETYKNRLTLVNNVYGELKQAAGDDRAAVLAIEVSEYDARAELAKTYTDVVKSAAADQVKAEADAAKARIDLAQEVARRVREAQTIHDDTDLLIAQVKNDTNLETKALLQQLDHRYADEQIKYKNNKQALLELDRWYEAQKAKINKDADRKIEQNTLSAYQNLSSGVTSLFNNIIALTNQQSENELQDYKNKNDAKKEALKARLDAGIINQNEYNSQVSQLDKEFAKKQAEIKADQAQKNRDAQIIEATATGIVTVLNAYNTGVAIPVVGIALGPAMAALAAATVATQIALLASTPIPQYAKGGVAQGASHAQGGIALVDSTSGRKVGEMEGGEPYVILSRESYRNNGAIIDALLDSSMNRGGAPIDLRAARMQPRFDYGGIFSLAKFANGGIFSGGNFSGSTDPQVIALLQLIAQRSNEPQRSYVVYDDIASGSTKLNNARTRASFVNKTS